VFSPANEWYIMPLKGRRTKTMATIQDVNRDLANQINAEARSNPQSPYANKFVGIANGKGSSDRAPSAIGAGPAQLLLYRSESGLR
jgi:hypothetical protein